MDAQAQHPPQHHSTTSDICFWIDELDLLENRLEWLWPDWIPRGYVTILAGPQAVGKSFLAAELIATVTGGRDTWPDKEARESEPGKALLLDTEEFRVPYWERLKAMGVPPKSVVMYGDSPWYLPKLPDDALGIQDVALHYECPLIVLDSLSGGHLIDENSADVRVVLQTLAQIAASTRAAVVIVHHTRKRSHLEAAEVTLDRIRGSSTISQFARSIIGLWRWEESDNSAPTRVQQIKNSLGTPPEAIGFGITKHGLLFGNAPQPETPYTARDEASDWLSSFLTEAKPASVIYKNAEEAGLSRTTLKRARQALQCDVYMDAGTWHWALPTLF